jgi:hypothetical protein
VRLKGKGDGAVRWLVTEKFDGEESILLLCWALLLPGLLFTTYTPQYNYLNIFFSGPVFLEALDWGLAQTLM